MDRIASVLVLGMIGVTGVVAVAGAACNEIPSADMLSLSAAGADRFGFKGALGRIDRLYVQATDASRTPSSPKAPAITVVPDGICVDASGRAVKVPSPSLESVDDLVALVYARTGGTKRTIVRAYGDERACAALTAAKAEMHDAMGAAIDVMPTCSTQGVRVVPAGRSTGLRIPLPDWSAVESTDPAAVRVVVAQRAAAPSLLAAAADEPCSELCGRAVEGHLAVCIDKIFAASGTADGRPVYSSDPIACDVQKPPLMKKNDFARACENDNDTSEPRCKTHDPVSLLKLWQDECGGVHVPFDWTGIRPPSNGMQGPRPRWVYGRTGVGGKKRDENPPVRIPGREFVGSTPFGDPGGALTDWRRPRIELWNESAEEPGLAGTVDQDDSIVHIYPRLATDLVCKGTGGGNACMGIEHQDGAGKVACACRDSNPEGCECERLTTGMRYFACGGGPHLGMPCTRDSHCKDGRCNGEPRCQKDGEVWTRPDDSGQGCKVEGECRQQGRSQCGFRLFNLESAIENVHQEDPPPKKGIIVLDAKLVANGPHKRRGVCKDGTPCGNGTGPGKCATGVCRGYQLKPGKVE
jgi:hypothetical protein